MNFINLLELDDLARQTLDPAAYDYIAGGADDEVTLRENRAAFGRWRLRPRYLVDVSHVYLSTTILGQPISFPVLVAPSAYHKLAHPDGELATARACAATGTIMISSTASTYPIGEIAAQGAPVWFQLYTYKERAITEMLLAKAVAAGAQALCLTIDVPHIGNRERDTRNRFTLPNGIVMANLLDADLAQMPRNPDGSGLAAYSMLWDPALTWDVIPWLKSRCNLPIVVKGIMTADDAKLAAENGAAAIVVSNHGGRQLDSVAGTLDVLPEIVDAVGGHLEVLLDGGVRRGTDVLKALALGARAVLLGRPVIWGLAIGGAEGATQVLSALRNELATDMMLAGRTKIADVDRSLVMKAPL
jgi:4-hydroxymandelate oxidase